MNRSSIPVIILSLTTAEARRAACRDHYNRLNIEFRFEDAVDARALTDEAIAALSPRPHTRDFGRPLTRGEIACAMSHLNMLRDVARGPDRYVCILEDDAVPKPGLSLVLDRATLDLLPPFDFLRLYGSKHRGPHLFIKCLGDHAIVAPVHVGYLTVGQIVSREGARRVLDQIGPLSSPIDNMIFRDARIALRTLQITPWVLEHDNADSSIAAERKSITTRARKQRSLMQVSARALFILSRAIMAWRNFVLCWGAGALLRLRFTEVRCRIAPAKP